MGRELDSKYIVRFIDQVKNGVAIRMAVLYELLGGAPIGENK